MKKWFYLVILLSNFSALMAQSQADLIKGIENEIAELENQRQILLEKLEDAKLNKSIADLKLIGLPTSDYVEHAAMILSYSEEHEQAKWVMHVISPDIIDGIVFRTNDFRADPLISSGTAVQEDYFLTDTLSTGKVNYDGFGYDRGHLAPSADFRWSKKALSESYFYSNMSPQVADFNRKEWADLEDHLRKYVIANKTPLYVVTAPLLMDDLPKISRSINGVSIPKTYAKFVYDPMNKRSIAFIMENKKGNGLLEQRATTIDKAEALLNIDVFSTIDAYEDEIQLIDWFENLQSGDKEPLAQEKLPKRHFNTVVGGKRVNKNSIVCGNVVSSRISRSGHLWLNIDKKFPNQIFSIFIRKEDLVNFPFDPAKEFANKVYCFEGKVESLNDVATINIKRAKQAKNLQ
ncbi:DNA/RNA non-specific endonuclease [Saprospiraceae bacterium]|nr:DNA/RNA non-specific endonuclease [Saprospiraceae bacterium]